MKIPETGTQKIDFIIQQIIRADDVKIKSMRGRISNRGQQALYRQQNAISSRRSRQAGFHR